MKNVTPNLPSAMSKLNLAAESLRSLRKQLTDVTAEEQADLLLQLAQTKDTLS